MSSSVIGVLRPFALLVALAAVAGSCTIADSGNPLSPNPPSNPAPAGSTVSTFAGGGSTGGTNAGNADGTGVVATFSNPQGIASDGTYLYVADTGNNLIRRIAISTGVVTTVAGGGSPGGTAIGHADGTGTAATFNQPTGLATDGTTLYVADRNNNVIRAIDLASAAVTTLAGGGSAGGIASGHTDGSGTAATFSAPTGVWTDGTYLFVADNGNGVLRKVTIATAAVAAIAGLTSVVFPGHSDGSAATATFHGPIGISSDGTSIFMSETNNNDIRRVTISSLIVSTLAGGGSTGGTTSGHADGTGVAATFSSPNGMVVAGGILYVADAYNHKIRQVDISTGVTTTLAGGGTPGNTGGYADGAVASSLFFSPQGIVANAAGTALYVVDGNNNLIRKIALQ